MNMIPIIHKVVYRYGMVTDPSNWQGLNTTVIEKSELPDQVVSAILDNNLLTAGRNQLAADNS